MYYKYLLFAILFGILYSFLCTEVSTLSDVVLYFGFKQYKIGAYSSFTLLQNLFPYFFFQIIFGTYIYRHFCTACIYHFTRVTNRFTWFLKECVCLYIYAIMYIFIMFASAFVVFDLRFNVSINKGSILLLVYYLLIASLFLFFITLMTNILAIQINSTVSFMAVTGIILFFIAIFIFWDGLICFTFSDEPTPEIIVQHTVWLKFNLLSHIMLDWHSSNIDEVGNLINKFGIKFDLNFSLLLWAILNGLTITVGTIVMYKKEFITNNAETNMQ